jgi:hypothetical protein
VLAEYYNTVTKKLPKCEANVKGVTGVLSIKKALNKLGLLVLNRVCVKKCILSL